MKILRHYIAVHVLTSIGIVTLALTGLQIFMLFLNQLPDIGKGNYDFLMALKVVGFQLPYQIYSLFPITSLLGVLMGLGVMANHRELVVMRASGVSVTQITLCVLQVAFILMMVITWLGESVIPQFNRFALDQKMQGISGESTLRTKYGVWIREHNNFVFISDVGVDRLLSHLLEFHFDEGHHLAYIRKINRLERVADHWEAIGVSQTNFFPESTQVQQFDRMPWEGTLQTSLLPFANAAPDEMTLKQLYTYIVAHQPSHQNISPEMLVFGQRLIQPISTMVMMLLAIPFVFGSLRASTIGAKMFLGICSGFVFYMMNHFLGSMSLVFQLPPILAVTLPTLIFATIGGVLLTRVR